MRAVAAIAVLALLQSVAPSASAQPTAPSETSAVGTTPQGDTPAAVTTDPPVDRIHPASMAYVRVPSHGALLNAVLYTAAGAGPHPTLLLLHGFPGNEQNLDLAQAVRRAGWNVLTLHYRGAWGSPGVFSFGHSIQDSDAALVFLSQPEVAAKYAIDTHRLFVAGHSMGGFMAASAAAHDPRVAGLVMISAWDIGRDGVRLRDPAVRQTDKSADFGENVIPLAGTNADALMDEAVANAARWDFVDFAPALASRPVLLVTADDGSDVDARRLETALQADGDRSVERIHMATDHPYSDHRIALESVVVEWLQRQGGSASR